LLKSLLFKRAESSTTNTDVGVEEPAQGLEEQVAPTASSEHIAQPDLSTTLDAFESRIQLRKSAKKVAESEADKALKARHAALLSTMMNIRRSLSQIAKLDLGDRFSLSLDADDWQGWPRLLVRLEDQLDPRSEYPYLQVVAHDRLEKAFVEFSQSNLPKLEKLSLVDKNDVQRLPAAMKRCVRSYLDLVEKIVIETELKADSDNVVAPIVSAALSDSSDSDGPDISSDIFIDDEEAVDTSDRLPVLEQLEALPLINSKLVLD